ncbi:MAG: class I fructose-bisphosphate aldolase [Candidatus Dojkabacteria bacterium]
MDYSQIQSVLGDKAENLLNYKSPTFKDQQFYKPNGNWVDEVMAFSDRSPKVLENLKRLYGAGRLANSGYLSIFPVDQGIEHSAGASFAKNPIYFDPENIVKLAVEAQSSGVASTLGALGLVSKKYAGKIPFIVKLNHNELLTYPNKFDEVMFSSVQQAFDMGAAGVGATIYFGSEESTRQIQEVSQAFAKAHELGMFTILWCYTRNSAFKKDVIDYHTSADLTGQANHLGVTIEADIIKQKLPTVNGGFKALNSGNSSYGKLDDRMYSELSTDHPIDLAKYQVANCYMGKIPLINSGGASGDNDLQEAIETAVINKRAGGSGLILGRKAFQKPFDEGVKLLNAVQDVYLCKEVDLA